MVLALKKRGYIIQINQSERVIDIKARLQDAKYFTETVSIPDLKPRKLGLYLIGFSPGQVDLLAIGVNTGTPSTLSARIKIKRAVQFESILMRDLISTEGMGPAIRNKIETEFNAPVAAPAFNEMLRRIIRRNEDLTEEIEKLIKIANGIKFNDDVARAEIFCQQQDALSAALKIASIKIPSLEDMWEPDEYENKSTYLGGFTDPEESQYVTEDQILAHDQMFFPDFYSSPTHEVATKAFSDGKVTILITAANRTKLEKILGVDFIYFNSYEKSFCFVQYKRMTNTKSSFSYYPSQDSNYDKDISLMERHTSSLSEFESEQLGEPINALYKNYRVFGSPFFFKFVRSLQFHPFQNSVTEGQYISFDMWLSLVKELQEEGRTIKASASTLSKHLTSNEFCNLLKRGLIGTRECSNSAIRRVLKESLTASKSVIFAYAAQQEDFEEDDEEEN